MSNVQKMVSSMPVSPDYWDEIGGDTSVIAPMVVDGFEHMVTEHGGSLVDVTYVEHQRRWIQPEDEDGNPTGEPFEIIDTRWSAQADMPEGWKP